MIYVGIDTGKKGAMAIYEAGCVNIIYFDYDKYLEAFKYLSNQDCIVYIENVHAMPHQGVTSMFNFGEHFGELRGMMTALGIPYELINPQKWKKEFSVTSDKNTSIEVARRLFPNVSLKPTSRCTKDSDGMAEALLIMEYCRRNFSL